MYKYIMKKNEGISRKTKHEISYEIINLFSNEKNIALLQIRSKIISHKCICIYIYILGLLPRPLVHVSDYMFFYSVQKSHPAFPVLTCDAHNAEGERQIEIALHDEKEDKMQRSGSIWIYIVIDRSTCLCLFGFRVFLL